MKKHLSSAAVLLSLLLVLCMYAFTSDRDDNGSGSNLPVAYHLGYLFSPIQGDCYGDFSQVLRPIAVSQVTKTLRTYPDFIVNGVSIGKQTARDFLGGSIYLAVKPVLRVLYPSAKVTVESGVLHASAPGLEMHAVAENEYFQVNGRYLYVPDGVLFHENDLLVPTHALARSLGCTVYEGDPHTIVIRRVGPAVTSHSYNEEDLYWLSRIIYAESGNQPMAGRVAVGTVILNRVASDLFPNTIQEVIFAPNQFSPVGNGMIYRDPDLDSQIAAMLCLDGVKEAGESLYFNTSRLNSWANKTKTYVATIGDHKFYM